MSHSHAFAAAFLIGLAAVCAAGEHYVAALLAGACGLTLGAVGAWPRRRKRGPVETVQLKPYAKPLTATDLRHHQTWPPKDCGRPGCVICDPRVRPTVK